jgi:hypothetical protein
VSFFLRFLLSAYAVDMQDLFIWPRRTRFGRHGQPLSGPALPSLTHSFSLNSLGVM